MCFNSSVSLLTFLLGCIFSLLLIYSKNKKYILENKITGLFFIFISSIQFMEFIFWIDIDNKIGINKIATMICPLLNLFQPNILYLIKIYYYNPNLFTPYHLIIAILNLLYFILSFNNYINFLYSEILITNIEKGHLKWKWIKYSYPIFYLILFVINIFYLFNIKYATILFLLSYIFLYISYRYFNYNIGELWCFFGAFIPLILYLIKI